MIPTIINHMKGTFQNIGATWDILAPCKEHAIEYAYKHINPEPKKMIDDYNYSMEYCLAHSGESINARYRKDSVDDTDRKIAATVDKNTTKTDLVLYRGVCNHVYKLMEQNAKDMPDCDLYEKGFLATSLVKGCEINCKKKLRIFVPAGTKAIYQGDVNDEQGYYEVDIMHGAKLKIVSIDQTYINCRLLETA